MKMELNEWREDGRKLVYLSGMNCKWGSVIEFCLWKE